MDVEKGDLYKSQLWKVGDDLEKDHVANNTKQVEGNKGKNAPNMPKTSEIPPIQL